MDRPKLYHYTSIEGVSGIVGFALETPRISLRATNIGFLNDTNELSAGIGFISNELHRYQEDLNFWVEEYNIETIAATLKSLKGMTFYVCSLTKAEDDLTQWRSYCPPQGGYCIGLDRGHLEAELEKLNRSCPGINQSVSLVDCIYSDLDKAESVEFLVSEWKSDLESEKLTKQKAFTELLNRASVLAGRFKDANFESEQEVRVLIWPNARVFPREYREFGGKLYVPYVTMNLDTQVLEEILVGPMTNQNLSVASLSLRVMEWVHDRNHRNSEVTVHDRNHRNSEVTVHESNISYRSFL
jgi:hypothetical protein